VEDAAVAIASAGAVVAFVAVAFVAAADWTIVA
jgi:hypothetical protein